MQKYSQLISRPGKAQYVILAILAVIVLIGTSWALVKAQQPGAQSIGFLGAYGTAIFILEAISAILLYAHFRRTGMMTFAVLSMAYLWVALLAPFQVGLLTDNLATFSLITASTGDAAWLWLAWHLGFPLIITAGMLVDGSYPIVTRRIWSWSIALFGVELLAIGGIVAGTLLSWIELPALISEERAYSDSLSLIYGPTVMFCCALALTVVVVKGKFENEIYAWLSLAMLAISCEAVLSIYAGARFSYGWYAARVLSLVSSAAVVISLLIETINLQHKVVKQNQTLKRMATMDELSGLSNRRELDERLKAEIKRAMRDRTTTSLILLDIDKFKHFNDTHGHLIGDLCLKHVAKCLQRNILRHTDLAARYGGEEFAILLPNTSENDAFDLAEHIRKTIAYSPIVMEDGKMLSVTASFGIASLVPSQAEDATELLSIADASLYSAKKAGRNCVQRPSQSWHASRDALEKKVSSNTHYLRGRTVHTGHKR